MYPQTAEMALIYSEVQASFFFVLQASQKLIWKSPRTEMPFFNAPCIGRCAVRLLTFFANGDYKLD
jgi:hypothetical protein